IEFQTPLYQDILALYKSTIAEGRTPEPDVFIKNGSAEIKKEVIDMIADRYEISQNWKDKFKIHIPREKEILNSVIYTNVLRLKFRMLQKLVDENMRELKQTKDPNLQE